VVREREREGDGRRTRVVALTANVFEEDRQRAFAVGMDVWLAKPFRKEELAQALRETDCQKLAPRDEIP
jgi:CheY-like chemotaxis protein